MIGDVKMKRRIRLKAIAILLSVSMITAMSLSVMTTTVSAAASGTNEPRTDNIPANSTDLLQSGQATSNVQSLGLSGSQPERLDASGNPIDKSNNTPLGAKAVNYSQILQLAVAGASVNSSNDLYDIYDNPVNTDNQRLNTSKSLLGADTLKGNSDWSRTPKDMTNADINGTGKDVVVVAAAVPATSSTLNLELEVIDYNSGNPVQKSFTMQCNIRKTSNYRDACQGLVHITAGDYNQDGKDEIAVALDTCLFVYSINEKSGSIDVKNLSVADLNGLIGYQFHYYDSRIPRIDIESGDSDQDGFEELLVTAGLSNSEDSSKTTLFIYHNTTDLNSPTAKIPLLANGILYNNASVAVGDVFGTGQNSIVIAGPMKDGTDKLTTINYDPEKGTYDTSLTNILYDLGVPGNNRTRANHVSSELQYLHCVSLKAPVPGQAQAVVYGDCIYQYGDASNNASEGGFVRQYVANSRSGNITGVRYTNKDQTYILKTLVGNFDGNSEGKQQIIMMYYNVYQNKDRGTVITACGTTSNGTINVYTGKEVNLGYYPAICAPDVFLNGKRLVYDKAEFTFSDPTIIAVLGATPYYKEIPNDSYEALGNCGTTYGTEKTTEQESEKGVSVHAGVTLGFSVEQSVFGHKVLEEDFEAKVEASFSNSWSNSKSFSTSIGYTGYYNQDTVVVSVIPYDIYYYKLYDTEHPNGVEMSINVPYAPQTTTLAVDDYNNVAKNLPNAPYISSDVLQHTVGDPRTYPSSTKDLTNIKDGQVLIGGDNRGNQFVSSGIGNSSTEESITTSTSSGVTKEHSVDVDISITVTVLAAKGGVNFGAGYMGSETITNTSSTTRTGSVAAVPKEYKNYQFQWSLVAYDYDAGTNGHRQQFNVISYLVKSLGQIPPAQPDNLVANTSVLDRVSLTWNQVKPTSGSPVTGYVISRSDDGANFTDIATTASIYTCFYNDYDIKEGKRYDYKVAAYCGSAASSGIPTDPVSVTALSVSNISISGQPDKLTYKNGDELKLDGLMVAMKYSDGRSTEVSASRFAVSNLSVSIGGLPVNLPVDADTAGVISANGGAKIAPMVPGDIPGGPAGVPGGSTNAPPIGPVKRPGGPTNTPESPANTTGESKKEPVSYKTGFILSAAETGMPITVTYNPTGLTALTKPLTVIADTSTALAVQLQFNVAGQNDAAKLLPNQQLYATANIANNQSITQNLLLMVVLYDTNGNMVNYAIAPGCIQAQKAVQIDTSNNKLALPADVSGYTAKAFIWDGTDITSSSLIPLCYPIQITG